MLGIMDGKGRYGKPNRGVDGRHKGMVQRKICTG